MPRRLVAALSVLLLLLVAAFAVGRRLRRGPRSSQPPKSIVAPTPRIPPTPIPARRVVLYFESAEDERLHPEARDLATSADETALLRSLAAAVLEGPRRPDLLQPFPGGWRVRSAYRLAEGLAVLDLEAPARPSADAAGATGQGTTPASWETGGHEEFFAAQSLLVSVTRNIPAVGRIVLLVGGEPAETLAGHLDLAHPLLPDVRLATDEPVFEPPPTPTPTPPPTPTPTAAPTPAATPVPPVPTRRPFEKRVPRKLGRVRG